MSKVLVDEANLTAIGNAIRAKNSSTDKYKPSEMADAINNIVGGGDDIEYLNYIELKNQYIDTGITPEPAYLYSYSFDVPDNKQYVALLGCRVSDGNSKSFGILQTPESNKIRLDFDDPDSNGTSTTADTYGTVSNHAVYRFYGNVTAIYASSLNNQVIYSKKPIKASTASGLTASIYLGAYHRQDDNSAIFITPSLKIYGFQITNSNTVIGNFIPASCNGIKGMYETVKNQFHGMDGSITTVNVSSVSTTGDLQVVSPDNWSYNIVQTANQTISGNPSAKIVAHNNGTYSSALSFNARITPNTGYVPGTIQKSADKANHVYTITATAAEEIAGMVENGYAKVYEDGVSFYYEDNYSDELYGLAGNILVAGMKNTDLSNKNFYSMVSHNNSITKFKNTFITGAGNNLLSKCSNLTLADLPNLESAGDSLLDTCSALTSANLHNLKRAGMNLLDGCTNLTSVDLTSLESTGNSVLGYSNTLTSVDLPNLTSVGNGLLKSCSALTSVSLPNLTTAGTQLLSSCTSLTAVGFPNLKSVGGTFLSNSPKLQSIYLRSATMCTLGGSTTLPSSVSIYVPASLIDSYKTADNWKKYASNFKPLTGRMPTDVTLNLRGSIALDYPLGFAVQLDPLNPPKINEVMVGKNKDKYSIIFIVSEEYQNCIIKLSAGADYSENINISYILDGSDKAMVGVISEKMFNILKPIAESGGSITLKITVVA